MTMNPEVKKLWVDALESGEYTQTVGMLKRNDWDGGVSHCCLGVLCDVLTKMEGEQYGTWNSLNNFVTGPQYNTTDSYDEYSAAFIPDVLGKALGIEWCQQNILASMNDQNTDFTETTQWIKENL